MQRANTELSLSLPGGWQLVPLAKQMAWRDAAAQHLLACLRSCGENVPSESQGQASRCANDHRSDRHQIASMQAWINEAYATDLSGMASLEQRLKDDWHHHQIMPGKSKATTPTENQVEHVDAAFKG